MLVNQQKNADRALHNLNVGRMVNVWFWRTYDRKEVDLVEESGGRFAGFEFKWGGGSARGAKVFKAAYPGATVETVEPANVWDFAGVPVKGN